MNKEKLNELLDTMNREQLLELCKSTTSIIDDLQQKIDKAIEYLEEPNRDNFDYSKAQLLDILRGEDNDK